MNLNAREALSTSLPWRAGWLFNVGVNLARARVTGFSLRFRALSTPGDLAPPESPPAWTFHLGLAAKPTRPVCAMRADGFIIEFAWDGRVCQALAAVVAPGVLAGFTDAPLVPSLFSALHEVHRTEHTEWVSCEHQHVVLIRRHEGTLLRFVLALGTESHSVVMGRAQNSLNADSQVFFAEGSQWRAQVFGRLQNCPFGTDALCVEALETLVARLELPCEQLPHAWCSTECKPAPSCDVNLVYALAAAWSVLEPAVAEDIVRATLALQRHDGAIPYRLFSGGAADYSRAPLPLLAQTVMRMVEVTRRRELARSLWPATENYLMWSLEHFSPEFEPPAAHVAPRSHSDASAPKDERRSTLALMLLAEIQSLHELSQVAGTSLQGLFWTEAERLRAFLETQPWLTWAMQHASETHPTSPPPAMNPLALLALSCSMLPENTRDTLAEYWERHVEEVADDRAPSWSELILLLDTAHRAKALVIANRLTHLLWRRVQLEAERGPSDSQKVRATSSAPRLLDAGLAAAVLCASAPRAAEPRHRKTYASRLLDWAEQHTAVSIALMLLVPSVLLGVGLSASLLKKALPPTQIQLTLGLAQELYRSGQYREAIAVYEELSKRGPRPAPLALLLGNAYYKAGDFHNAEMCFRSALEHKEQAPMAMLNLALTLYRLGRHDESAELYARFVDEYERQYPLGANRARTALMLIQQLQAGTNRSIHTPFLM